MQKKIRLLKGAIGNKGTPYFSKEHGLRSIPEAESRTDRISFPAGTTLAVAITTTSEDGTILRTKDGFLLLALEEGVDFEAVD